MIKDTICIFELDRVEDLIYRSFFYDISCNDLGSSSLATMTKKKGRTLSENEAKPFWNDFWSISSHLTCEVFV